MGATYTIGTMAGLTGLSPHTIRAWERRYDALSPQRTESNRRIYLDEDVARLTLLKRAVDAGHSIGQVARLTSGELKSLGSAWIPSSSPVSERNPREFLSRCLSCIERLDADALNGSLAMATAALGVIRLLDDVVVPLLREIEARWLAGSILIAHEHMASAVLRTYLEGVRTSLPPVPMARRLVVTTPINQHHEIGALIVAVVAAMQSWSVTYLGPNLPAREIAHAAQQCSAQVVALSLVFPSDDPELTRDLVALREVLNPWIQILVGGRAAKDYGATVKAIGAQTFEDLGGFRDYLTRLETSR